MEEVNIDTNTEPLESSQFPAKKGTADRSKIDIQEEHEVSYWVKELGVSKEQLAEAVKAVGPSVTAVRRRLQNKTANS